MVWSKRAVITTATLIFCTLVGTYGYFVVTTFRNFEFLLMCSQGKESLIPKYACQSYLFHFAGSPSEISDINRGIGVLWALSSEDRQDKIKLLRFLLKKGVDINALNEQSGVSTLHAMVIENDPEAVELLLTNGANPVVKDKKGGKTPLEFALERQGKPGQPDRTLIIDRLKSLTKS